MLVVAADVDGDEEGDGQQWVDLLEALEGLVGHADVQVEDRWSVVEEDGEVGVLLKVVDGCRSDAVKVGVLHAAAAFGAK